MADRENPIPTKINKATRKRPIQSAEEDDPPTKKRVVLGDLTNFSLDASARTQNSGLGKPRKRRPESESESESERPGGNGVDSESVVGPRSDEPINVGYASSIYHYLRSMEVEVKRRPLSTYMEKVQDDIHPSMRTKLIDWLVEVAEEYKLVSDTLYLTVNYIDRYLSAHKLMRDKLQLLGVSCMLVASKYEEISPPHIEDFCYITDNTCTRDEVVLMERDVLNFLEFEMGNPTIKTFLRIFNDNAQGNPMFSNLQFEFLCCYIAELSLTDYDCIRYISSIVAASTIFLARLTISLKFHPWSPALQKQTGYKPYELRECVLRLHSLLLRSETSALAVRQKYMDHKFKCVASMVPPLEIPACFFEVSR